MAAFDQFTRGQVDVKELVVDNFSHMEKSAIHHCYSIARIHDLIHVETVQVGYVLNLHVVLDGHS
jgi:hypothetical protein